jgi:hypothetical protein
MPGCHSTSTLLLFARLSATHHLFQPFQPQLEDKPRRKLRRLSQRLLKILPELDHLTPK